MAWYISVTISYMLSRLGERVRACVVVVVSVRAGAEVAALEGVGHQTLRLSGWISDWEARSSVKADQ